MKKKLRILFCQKKSVVGNIERNTSSVIESVEFAKEQRVDFVVFPELFLSGYPPEDLLYRPDMKNKITSACQQLAQTSETLPILVGSPWYQKEGIYNAALWFQSGKLAHIHRKKTLPDYSVFDESRYFLCGQTETIVFFHGIKIMLSICEEIWSAEIQQQIQQAQADFFISINGSPFYLNKQEERQSRIRHLAQETQTPIAYLNLYGGQDELVFDGGSCVVDARGNIIGQAKQFAEQHMICDLEKQTAKTEESNKNTQAALLLSTNKQTETLTEEQQTFRALCCGLKDYIESNGFTGVLLGLSGGIDSALVLVIACAALGSERVRAVMMPYTYTASISKEDATTLAQNYNVQLDEIHIHKPVSAFLELLAPLHDTKSPNWQTTHQNIQARCRGLLLMAMSNASGQLLLATGNKSEMAVGYATLYGDMAGGFAPLKDVSKTMVYRLARYCNTTTGTGIPQRIITRAPSAELLPEQKDSDNLPDYGILDQILSGYIEQAMNRQQLAEIAGAEESDRVLAMVDNNEYKRKQAAIGTKVTKVAFGKDRRLPVSCHWSHK